MSNKILVVDDEHDIRALIVAVLLDAGYETEELCDGTDIVERVTKIDPQLILLDLTMPDVDGFESLRLLKADIRTELIPVIVSTAQARKDSIIKVRDLGAADFLVKPWEGGELEYRIRSLLGSEDQSGREVA